MNPADQFAPRPAPLEDPGEITCDLAAGCSFRGSWAAYLAHAPVHPITSSITAREPWLHSRQTFIGASEVPAVIGVNPWAGPLEVWADKLQPRTDPPFVPIPIEGGGHVVSPPTLTGTILEPFLLRGFEERHACRILQPTTARHRRLPWLAATPDADVVEGGDGEVQWGDLCQVKVVGWRVAPEWEEGIPPYVLYQVQTEMEVFGREQCWVLALVGTEIREYLVERDPEMMAPALVMLEEFWRYVVERQPPIDFDLRATQNATLFRLWPKVRITGLQRIDDSDLIAAAASYDEQRAIESEARKEKEALANQLKAAIGDREGMWWGSSAKHPNGYATWKCNNDGVNLAAIGEELLAREPEAEREALRKKHAKPGARVLQVKVKKSTTIKE